jgi:ElaB/YqjD/DUF883 family membrane-anchored ribosome-binding protein
MTKGKLEVIDNHADLGAINEALRTLRDDVKKDMANLKDQIVEEGRHEAKYLKKRAREGYEEVQDMGLRSLGDLEKRVKANPTQSVALAFAAGIVASVLLGRRG